MKYILLIALLTLVSCSPTPINVQQIQISIELCKENGGIKYIYPVEFHPVYENRFTAKVTCQNSAKFSYNEKGLIN